MAVNGRDSRVCRDGRRAGGRRTRRGGRAHRIRQGRAALRSRGGRVTRAVAAVPTGRGTDIAATFETRFGWLTRRPARGRVWAASRADRAWARTRRAPPAPGWWPTAAAGRRPASRLPRWALPGGNSV